MGKQKVREATYDLMARGLEWALGAEFGWVPGDGRNFHVDADKATQDAFWAASGVALEQDAQAKPDTRPTPHYMLEWLDRKCRFFFYDKEIEACQIAWQKIYALALGWLATEPGGIDALEDIRTCAFSSGDFAPGVPEEEIMHAYAFDAFEDMADARCFNIALDFEKTIKTRMTVGEFLTRIEERDAAQRAADKAGRDGGNGRQGFIGAFVPGRQGANGGLRVKGREEDSFLRELRQRV